MIVLNAGLRDRDHFQDAGLKIWGATKGTASGKGDCQGRQAGCPVHIEAWTASLGSWTKIDRDCQELRTRRSDGNVTAVTDTALGTLAGEGREG